MKNFKVVEAEDTAEMKIIPAELTKLRPACEVMLQDFFLY